MTSVPDHRTRLPLVGAALLILATTGSDPDTRAAESTVAIPGSRVGLPVQVRDLVLPGSELEPIPLTDETPVVIRVDAVYGHGSDHRYDFVVSALEPGTFNLSDFLRRKDGTAASDLPALAFAVDGRLPPGQIEPNRPASRPLPWYGDYRVLVSVLTGLWVAGLVALLRVGRRRRTDDRSIVAEQPISLADRLRPLVGRAMAGELDSAQLAELERALIALWRRRAGLDGVPASELMSRLHEHPEAGPLLVRLESWLHRPPSETVSAKDEEITALLAPYADLPADALDTDPTASLAASDAPGPAPIPSGGAAT